MVDLRLNVLNAGHLFIQQNNPSEAYALFHTLKAILCDLTDRPSEQRVWFRHLEINRQKTISPSFNTSMCLPQLPTS